MIGLIDIPTRRSRFARPVFCCEFPLAITHQSASSSERHFPGPNLEMPINCLIRNSLFYLLCQVHMHIRIICLPPLVYSNGTESL